MNREKLDHGTLSPFEQRVAETFEDDWYNQTLNNGISMRILT